MSSESRILASSTKPSALSAWQRFSRKPAVAHAIRAAQRFLSRLGNQFGAAVTYFSVLAIIPTLMFAFAALGFTLEVVRPDLVSVVSDRIQEMAPGQDQFVSMLQNFLDNWQAVGIVGVLTALYTAQGFIGNLKDAIRAQLRKEMGTKPPENFVLRTLNNIVALLGILIGVGLTIALTAIGTGLQSAIVSWLNLPGWVKPIMAILPNLISLGMAWLIFMFIFSMIPLHPINKRTKMIGSLIGAIALTVLLNLATVLISVFSNSPTAALFGPVIAIMLSMNVFARIILFVAAWMGTADDEPIFSHIPASDDSATELDDSRAETIGALAAAAGVIAVTLIGIRRWEDHKEHQS